MVQLEVVTGDAQNTSIRVFQFRYGTIKSNGGQPSHPVIPVFNSFMVQLEVITYQSLTYQSVSSNSFMVQLKRNNEMPSGNLTCFNSNRVQLKAHQIVQDILVEICLNSSIVQLKDIYRWLH